MKTMFVRPVALILTGLVASASIQPGKAEAATSLTIAVNFGHHKTAEAAADSQASVDWYDGDPVPDTVCTEAYAAVELRRYLCKMAGLDPADAKAFPIVDDDQAIADLDSAAGDWLVVGSLANNRLTSGMRGALRTGDRAPGNGASGGFQIKTVRSRTPRWKIVLLCGNDRAGTLYAVYEFLERLGCRWYGPGEVNEEVPERLPDPLPDINIVDWPRFRTRGFWAWEDRGNPDFFDWMARNRMNLWTVAESDIADLKKRCIQLTCGGHQQHERFLNPSMPYPYDHPKFKGDESKPKDPYKIGDEYRGDTSGDGVLTYGEAHPEWYGLRGRKRITDLSAGVNFCTSNRDAVAEMMKNLVQDLIDGQWRYADSVNFWTLDGGRWCQCKNCQALGTPTDRNLLLVHALRKQIQRARRDNRLHRDVEIEFLAYADVIAPPSRPLPPDFDYEHCIATFFPIVRCYVHRFDDPTCTEFNTRYQKDFYGWAIDPNRHYRGQIFIGEYYNVSGYKNLPILYYKTMPHDIRYFYQHGARHMHYMHVPTGNWGPRTLTNYMFAKLLWNPDIDEAALMDEYFRGRYGAVAPLMRRFYESLERALCNVSVLKYHLGRRLGRGQKPLFNKDHMHYAIARPRQNDGPDFVEIVKAIRDGRRMIGLASERAGRLRVGRKIQSRLYEDRRLFLYAANTILFYDALIRAQLRLDEGNRDRALAAFKQAQRYADLLRRDTESTKWASSHANARNGLEASYAAPALERLRKALKLE